jgi:tRNA(fMet)-specific endonuclease VapC
MSSGADVRVVLDTSAYSHFRAGRDEVLDLLARADTVLIPAIVLGELDAAFEAGLRAKENRVRLAEFLDEPFVNVLPVTSSVARHYGRLVGELRRAGTPIPTNDVWIAATTADCGATLVTFDRHFDRLPALPRVVLEV